MRFYWGEQVIIKRTLPGTEPINGRWLGEFKAWPGGNRMYVIQNGIGMFVSDPELILKIQPVSGKKNDYDAE